MRWDDRKIALAFVVHRSLLSYTVTGLFCRTQVSFVGHCDRSLLSYTAFVKGARLRDALG